MIPLLDAAGEEGVSEDVSASLVGVVFVIVAASGRTYICRV